MASSQSSGSTRFATPLAYLCAAAARPASQIVRSTRRYRDQHAAIAPPKSLYMRYAPPPTPASPALWCVVVFTFDIHFYGGSPRSSQSGPRTPPAVRPPSPAAAPHFPARCSSAASHPASGSASSPAGRGSHHAHRPALRLADRLRPLRHARHRHLIRAIPRHPPAHPPPRPGCSPQRSVPAVHCRSLPQRNPQAAAQAFQESARIGWAHQQRADKPAAVLPPIHRRAHAPRAALCHVTRRQPARRTSKAAPRGAPTSLVPAPHGLPSAPAQPSACRRG